MTRVVDAVIHTIFVSSPTQITIEGFSYYLTKSNRNR